MNAKDWAVDTVETIMSRTDPDGYHPDLRAQWAYVNGMTLLAILRTGELTGDGKYFDYVKKHVDLFVEPLGSIRTYLLEEYNLDQINMGKVLFPVFKRTGESRYTEAAHLLVEQLKGHPRTSEGGFWHKKIYPFQMWLDGLYMASPFLAEYAQRFDRPELFDEVALQLVTVEKHTRDPRTGLLRHGWDESGEQEWCDPATGRSHHVWGRAMGWYAMAMVDSLERFPRDHAMRGTLAGLFERVVGALERAQDGATGLWYQVVDQGPREGNYLEASGSSMFVYAIAKGVRLGFLSRYYRAVAVKGWEGLLGHLVERDEEGVHVHRICKGAGLGNRPYRDGSYTYYVNERIVSDHLMGVAPFVFAAVETAKLESIPDEAVGDSGRGELAF